MSQISVDQEQIATTKAALVIFDTDKQERDKAVGGSGVFALAIALPLAIA